MALAQAFWRLVAHLGVQCRAEQHGRHQLKEPVDVTVEPSSGGLIIADFGNARVVRWAAPAPPAELLAAVKS